jgi:hypothetical protein
MARGENIMKLPVSIALAAFAASVTLVSIASAAQSNQDIVKCGEDKKEDKKDEDQS